MARIPALLLACLSLAAALACTAPAARAFTKDGCGTGECSACHTLTVEEARRVLGDLVDTVGEVRDAPVKGMWAVNVSKGDRAGILFIDYEKKHAIQAQVVRLDTREDVTAKRKIDLSKVPLKNALLEGKADARRKIVVFSDPDCHFCRKLHESIRAVVAKTPDVAFHTILYSRLGDAATTRKAQAVLCTKSPAMLHDAYEGRPLPDPSCEGKEAEENGALAKSLGIFGTPAMILPDGQLVPGFREPETILRLLEESEKAAAAERK